MRSRLRTVILALGGALLGLLACGPAPDGTLLATPTPLPPPTATAVPPPRPTAAPPALSPASSPVPIRLGGASRPPRVGQLGELSDAGFIIGLAKGFYAERGLAPRAVAFASAADLLAALAADQLDAGSLPISAELLTALERGARLKIVAEASGAPPGHGAAGLVVRPDLVEQLRTPTDLRGFRIGLLRRGDALDVELAALLKRGWLARTDVEVVMLTASEVESALAEGSLEAAMLPEPHASRLSEDGLGVVWRRSDAIVPNHLSAALVFNARFARAQPETARQYVTAYLKAARLYNDAFLRGSSSARDEVMGILSARTAITDPKRLARIVMPGINPNGMVNIQTLRLDQQYFRLSGQLSREVDIAAVVDPQFAAYAITQLGEYR